MTDSFVPPSMAGFGIPGLDHLLRGGLPREMVYLVHGSPGAGKTTLGFQFLQEGIKQGERVLYASLLQTRRELEVVLHSHGWSLDGMDLLELPDNVRRAYSDEQTLFGPGEVELHEVIDLIVEAIERHRPQRLVFDSLTELAILVDSRYQLRRQVLKLKQQLNHAACTTIFTANEVDSLDLPPMQTSVHGVIELGIHRPYYGPTRRWLEVTKLRGVQHLSGRHDTRLVKGGLVVHPRLEIRRVDRSDDMTLVSSGNRELDDLFGGGLEEGTACLIAGTTGAGKSILSSLYVQAAAERQERSIIFCFDERRQTFIRRAEGLNMPITRYMEEGLVDLQQVDAATMTPGEIADRIRQAVEEQGVKVVVIDSVTGYINAMPEQRQLIVQLHEIISYLGSAGVLTILIIPTHGTTDNVHGSMDVNTSYLADTVVLMRHFEAVGQVRRCVSVLKKRHGNHESTIREITIGSGGVRLGSPMTEFRGVLAGTPEYLGKQGKLLGSGVRDDDTTE